MFWSWEVVEHDRETRNPVAARRSRLEDQSALPSRMGAA
jgi:hypothetical protein